jgi:hypothetical protein
VVNVLTNAPQDAPKVVERLIAAPAVRRVNFTGSTNVGRIIAQHCATHLKPVLLELGGKNPLVVLDDADIDEAVEAAAFSAFFNQGQICMSADRIIVDNKIADAFLDKFVAKTSKLKAAHADAPLAGMIDSAAAQRVSAMLEDAQKRGARVLQNSSEVQGNLMQPAIVDGVTPEMQVYQQESFGPIVSILRFDTEEEALRLANDSEYGLSAAVFSRDIGRAMAVAKRIESGICHINGPTVHDEAQMPFGGVSTAARDASAARRPLRSSRSCAGSRSRPRRAITRSKEAAWTKQRLWRSARSSWAIRRSRCFSGTACGMWMPSRRSAISRRVSPTGWSRAPPRIPANAGRTARTGWRVDPFVLRRSAGPRAPHRPVAARSRLVG